MIAPADQGSRSFDFVSLLNGEQCDAATLRHWLIDARQRTRLLTDDLEGERELGPRLRIVNPPRWELAHIAWFQEYWCLRFRNGDAPLASMIAGADALYNSAIAAHATRWELPLLSWRSVRDYQDSILERVMERIERGPLNEQLCYFVMLSVFHEDMHGEAFHFTRQTLGYPRPPALANATRMGATARPNVDVCFGGGTLLLGASRGSGFAFDNECWEHEVKVAPFAISAAPVTVSQYEAFVEDGGYGRDDLWSREGAEWRKSCDARQPVYWEFRDARWWLRAYDEWMPISQWADRPMLYINAHEAEAYCRWAGRRLPSEAQWVIAASRMDAADGLDPAGWTWTADVFAPFPGFSPGPYAEYSAPWFGDHRVLRGHSDQTHPRMRRTHYRNFFTPDRRDVRAGFRTCAP